MNKEEIKQIIPHREPMLLVDEAEVTGATTGHGKKTITGEEFMKILLKKDE